MNRHCAARGVIDAVATGAHDIPLVLVSGPGAAARNIGIVLVTGMIIGTLFTLFIVPVFYSLIAAQHQPNSTFEAAERKAGLPAVARSAAGIA